MFIVFLSFYILFMSKKHFFEVNFLKAFWCRKTEKKWKYSKNSRKELFFLLALKTRIDNFVWNCLGIQWTLKRNKHYYHFYDRKFIQSSFRLAKKFTLRLNLIAEEWLQWWSDSGVKSTKDIKGNDNCSGRACKETLFAADKLAGLTKLSDQEKSK